LVGHNSQSTLAFEKVIHYIELTKENTMQLKQQTTPLVDHDSNNQAAALQETYSTAELTEFDEASDIQSLLKDIVEAMDRG